MGQSFCTHLLFGWMVVARAWSSVKGQTSTVRVAYLDRAAPSQGRDCGFESRLECFPSVRCFPVLFLRGWRIHITQSTHTLCVRQADPVRTGTPMACASHSRHPGVLRIHAGFPSLQVTRCPYSFLGPRYFYHCPGRFPQFPSYQESFLLPQMSLKLSK